MAEALNYASPRRHRRIRWYHWIPLALLVLFLSGVAVYMWLKWGDPAFWDM